MSDRVGTETCQRCGGRNIVWHAPSPLWNAVMRNAAGDDLYGIVCPLCFAELAETAGVVTRQAWHLTVEPFPDVPMVSADGRVWDADQCLWVEPLEGENEQWSGGGYVDSVAGVEITNNRVWWPPESGNRG